MRKPRGETISWFSAADAAELWKMRSDSSALGQRLSALKQYGLLHDSGRGAERVFELTPLARRILGEDQPADFVPDFADLRVAALRPRVFADLFDELRSTETVDRAALLRSLTTRDPPFGAKAAEDLLRIFRETAAYARLTKGTTETAPEHDFGNDGLDDLRGGDLLEVEGNRIRIQYRNKPRRRDFEMLRDYFELKLKHAPSG